MTVRIARAIACALLLLAVTGNVAFAADPRPPLPHSVPADPGYEGRSVPADPGYDPSP